MDGPRGYYAKWNKSVRERQVPYVLLYVECKEHYKWKNKTQIDS